MRRVRMIPGLLVALLFAGHAALAALSSQQPVIAITDVTVIDVEHDRSIDARTVLLESGRIVALTASADAQIPANAQRVDGRGKFLIPGLVDMHVHLFNGYSKRPPNTWAFPLFVANGVTAVREMNAAPGDMAIARQWRARAAAGELVAPRIVEAGVAANGRTTAEARARVDAAAAAGAEFIKVFSEVPAAQWRAILDEAHTRLLPVSGHVPAGVPLPVAAQAGQRTDQHLMQTYEACSTKEASLIHARASLDIDALAERRDTVEADVLAAFDATLCNRVACRRRTRQSIDACRPRRVRCFRPPGSRCSLSRPGCRRSCRPVLPARRRIRACSPGAGWR